MSDKPISIGRIVIFTDENSVKLPAIVTKVWNDDCVNLWVFPNGSEVGGAGITKTSVIKKTLHPQARAWDWPEIV